MDLKIKCNFCENAFKTEDFENHLQECQSKIGEFAENCDGNGVVVINFAKSSYRRSSKYNLPIPVLYLKQDTTESVPTTKSETIDPLEIRVEHKNQALKSEHPSGSDNPTKFFQCDVCQVTFPKNQLEAHLNTEKHKSLHVKADLICKFCGKISSNPSNLKRHILKLHNKAKFENKYHRYPCDKCDKMFLTPYEVKKHKILIHEKTRMKCDFCNVAYYSAKRIKEHRVKFHGERYKCEFCEKTFEEGSDLVKHFFMTYNTKIVPCDYCSEYFNSTAEYGEHKKTCKYFKDFVML